MLISQLSRVCGSSSLTGKRREKGRKEETKASKEGQTNWNTSVRDDFNISEAISLECIGKVSTGCIRTE